MIGERAGFGSTLLDPPTMGAGSASAARGASGGIDAFSADLRVDVSFSGPAFRSTGFGGSRPGGLPPASGDAVAGRMPIVEHAPRRAARGRDRGRLVRLRPRPLGRAAEPEQQPDEHEPDPGRLRERSGAGRGALRFHRGGPHSSTSGSAPGLPCDTAPDHDRHTIASKDATVRPRPTRPPRTERPPGPLPGLPSGLRGGVWVVHFHFRRLRFSCPCSSSCSPSPRRSAGPLPPLRIRCSSIALIVLRTRCPPRRPDRGSRASRTRPGGAGSTARG